MFSIARYAVPVSILLAGSNKKLRLGVPDFPCERNTSFPAVCCTTCINPSASERLTAYGLKEDSVCIIARISDSSTPYFRDAWRTMPRYLCARLSRWFGTMLMVTL
ncbi:Uncharacterised protein [Shigella sonnei]|nr:Uncharacterised protein [Shigella sonnei]